MSDSVAPDQVDWSLFLHERIFDEAPGRNAHARRRCSEIQPHAQDQCCADRLSPIWTTQSPLAGLEHLTPADLQLPWQAGPIYEACEHGNMSDEHECTHTDIDLEPASSVARSPDTGNGLGAHTCAVFNGIPVGGPTTNLPKQDKSSMSAQSREDNSQRLLESERDDSLLSYPVSTHSAQRGSFACDVEGCSKTSSRKHDLERHKRTQHFRKARFDCPEKNCKFRGIKANARRDKFISHLRQGHPRPETESWLCPRRDCDIVLPELNLLAAHLLCHDYELYKTEECRSAVQDAVLKEPLQCPLSGCKQRCQFEKMAAHLKDIHTADQRKAQEADIQTCGLSWHDCCFLCPICCTPMSGLGDLHKHIAAEHVLLDTAFLKPFTEWWPSRWACEPCDLELGDDVRNIRVHMRKHIKNPQEVLHYREQIFKVWPAFVHHPVFDDLRPTEWSTTKRFQDLRENF